ncbi:hypothetical protein PR003_g11898 [Phytophthora rubi]|uniref:Chromo domain-containing protein n=1 Tax=Phytophthora rubi TaxID=129364 RepID=A0A6A4FAL0_9STRA|nr:hypothetical protein PR002_g11302 [Phytophthora rubi]KAE9030839.1 hypothetical protein PR001_g11160 [Phytophthora rubi]KAE9337677.1 hypothetical protein PR003_g11898 [Phytophthora rubi]
MVLGFQDITSRRREICEWWLLVYWEALQNMEDSWETLVSLNKDVPALVEQ